MFILSVFLKRRDMDEMLFYSVLQKKIIDVNFVDDFSILFV